MRNNRQRGFTLPEALLAALIAAGVIAAASSSFSKSFRAARLADNRMALLAEAQNLAARLESDMPIGEIELNFPDWTVTTETLINPATRTERFVPQLITATHDAEPPFSFTALRIVETPEK